MRDRAHHDPQDIRPALRPFRRRLVMVAFLESLIAIGAAGLVAYNLAIVAARPTTESAVVWLAAVVLGSSVAAAAVAWRSWRPLIATAAAVDHRLRLEDRATTALDCLGASDAVSQLVIADARAHLEAHEPREIPLRSPLAARTIAIGLLATLVILAVRFGPSGWASSENAVRQTGGPATTVAGSAPPGPRTPEPPKNGAPPTAEISAAAPERLRTGPGAGERQPAAAALARPASVQGRETAPSSGASQLSATTRASDASGVNDGRGRGAPGADLSRAQDTSDARVATGQGVTTSAASSSESARAGAGAGAGTGGGATTPAGGRAAGGVRGAAIGQPSPLTSTAAVDRAAYMLKYRSALRTAESAVGQERVPDRLRRYVHDYFIAIHPDADRGGQR